MVYFISGHRNITQEKFDEIYVPIIKEAAKDERNSFVVGDCVGVDMMAQIWLAENLKNPERVTVYHMFDLPRFKASEKFNVVGGFRTDIERDSKMTEVSDSDIAFIGKGRWTSGTAQNILRRYEI